MVASIDQTAQITNRIESQARSLLEQVRTQAESSNLDPDLRAQIADEAQSLVESEERGPTFLGRVGGFVTRVRELLQPLGEAAATVLPVVEKLGLLAA